MKEVRREKENGEIAFWINKEERKEEKETGWPQSQVASAMYDQ